MFEISYPLETPKTDQSIKTHSSIIINNEDVESYYKRMHNRFSWALLAFTFTSAFGFLYLVAYHQNMYFIQCSQCKTVFFGGFYFYFLSIFLMLMIYLKNLRTDIFNPKDDIFLLNGFKYILSVFGGQLIFVISFFAGEGYYCSINLGNILIDQLIYQILQFSVMFFINFLYFIKVYKEAEPVMKMKEEKSQKQSIEMFNASFALNETKSEIGYGVNKNQNAYLARLELNQTGNTSQFTTSVGDKTNMVSVMSLESILVPKGFVVPSHLSPQKRKQIVRDIER